MSTSVDSIATTKLFALISIIKGSTAHQPWCYRNMKRCVKLHLPSFNRRSSTSRRHSRVFQASAEGPLFIFIISNDKALSMLKLNEDVVGDSKARVLEQMGEIRSAVEMAQLEAEKKHDEVVDEMLVMLNAKAEASRLKEVEQEVGKDVDEE
ncbi:hypothetical protein LOK49_LG13G00446 [Camellia lanceoleosa]|uniref:Uncharacterized protein n=1 Tax=Camellia lanceoleosa TaxID=1840588 RepID=A0ACC0FJT3_9ERIC|nr:hypothetical protein LOK49_LG13G00446 [Camellia lanceoleosa]